MDLSLPGKKKESLDYLYHPPLIKPNYGKPKRDFLPKTNLTRVLLYDNLNQIEMLKTKKEILELEKIKVRRLIDWHQRTFIHVVRKRHEWHAHNLERYEYLKHEYEKEYGTIYSPDIHDLPYFDPFHYFARLAPQINVLAFFLDAFDVHIPTRADVDRFIATQMEHHTPGRSAGRSDSSHIGKADMLATFASLGLCANITEDPRFRNLQHTLVPPSRERDGYMTLSPSYLSIKNPQRRMRKLTAGARLSSPQLPSSRVSSAHSTRGSTVSALSRKSTRITFREDSIMGQLKEVIEAKGD